MPRAFFLRIRGGRLSAFNEEIYIYNAELAKALISINFSLLCIQRLLSGLTDKKSSVLETRKEGNSIPSVFFLPDNYIYT